MWNWLTENNNRTAILDWSKQGIVSFLRCTIWNNLKNPEPQHDSENMNKFSHTEHHDSYKVNSNEYMCSLKIQFKDYKIY